MAKSLMTAYICWIFGGILGLHHLYLRRDRQAFVYFSSLGGYLIGYIYDIYKMPDYVREANQDPVYVKKLEKLQFQLKTPAFLVKRFVSCILVGTVFYNLMTNCVLLEKDKSNYSIVLLLNLIAPTVSAFIIYYIGTDGPMECDFGWPLLGSNLGFTIRYYFYNIRPVNVYFVFLAPVLATFLLNWNISWDKKYLEKKKTNEKLYKRILKFVTLVSLFLVLFGVYSLNNFKIKDKDGNMLTLKEAATDFYNSEKFKELRNSLTQIWNFYQMHGLSKLIDQMFYGGNREAMNRSYSVN